jgi:hypothetical protein
MADWCSLSPDGFLGVEWSLSCMAHDGRYDAGKTIIDKIRADLDLSLDIWALAALADSKWKVAVIRTYAVGVFFATSTFGLYNWFKAGDKN